MGRLQFAEHPSFIDQAGTTVFGVRSTTHIEHGNVALIINQLKEVTVAGEDAYTPTISARLVGEGAEHIIGFIARGKAKGKLQVVFKDLLQLFEVLEKDVWRNITIGLVVDICLMAEGWLSCIKGDHNPLWAKTLAVVQECF